MRCPGPATAKSLRELPLQQRRRGICRFSGQFPASDANARWAIWGGLRFNRGPETRPSLHAWTIRDNGNRHELDDRMRPGKSGQVETQAITKRLAHPGSLP